MNLSGPRHSVGKSVYFRRPARIPSATLAPAPKHQGQRRSRVQGGRAKAPGQLSRWPVSGKLKRSGQGWAATPCPAPGCPPCCPTQAGGLSLPSAPSHRHSFFSTPGPLAPPWCTWALRKQKQTSRRCPGWLPQGGEGGRLEERRGSRGAWGSASAAWPSPSLLPGPPSPQRLPCRAASDCPLPLSPSSRHQVDLQ